MSGDGLRHLVEQIARDMRDPSRRLTINQTETEVGAAHVVNDNIFAETTRLDDCLVVVSGPDRDDEICILGGAEMYLSRDTAKALALEILKRLEIWPMELEY